MDFCRKYGIAFLIVDDRHFTPAFLKGGYFLFPGDKPHLPGIPGAGRTDSAPFFAPFDEQIHRLTADRDHFALLSDPSFHLCPWISSAPHRYAPLVDPPAIIPARAEPLSLGNLGPRPALATRRRFNKI